MRTASIERSTKETQITLSLDLGGGPVKVDTGIGFFDHMLTALFFYSGFGAELTARGDLHVDAHHTVEDVGIVLGQAFAQAIGDKRGIVRYGDIALPMDEALVLAAVDFSGRGALYWDMQVPYVMLGEFDATLAKEFFIAFATNAEITLHVKQLAGENLHHVIECLFKAVARALRAAVASDPRAADALPSTKGVL